MQVKTRTKTETKEEEEETTIKIDFLNITRFTKTTFMLPKFVIDRKSCSTNFGYLLLVCYLLEMSIYHNLYVHLYLKLYPGCKIYIAVNIKTSYCGMHRINKLL